MLKTIDIEKVEVGMYVILSRSWFSHDFLANQFIIKDKNDLKKLKQSGLKTITIDTTKGRYDIDFTDSMGHGNETMTPPKEWKSDKLVSDELRAAALNDSLPSKERAKAVYNFSLQIMKNLLNSPTAKNISQGKIYINETVDTILSDDETAKQLLKITSHDFYTYTHSVNVGVLSVLLSKRLFKGSSTHNMHELGAGYFLHDMGKTKVDSNIINKPGRLNEEELNEMRTHPFQGYKILQAANELTEECRIIVMQHHEREDGNGYPRKLKGNEIHDYGRIGCIADVFDALTAERSYKKSLTAFEALKIMKEDMINHFHKEIFEQFVLLFK
ncbi:MAG: HD-GYP domain-containing protein [Nitrospirae bacterium]|nr:HD-GYP domain-containing protein [Nitrospirota bacterium]